MMTEKRHSNIGGGHRWVHPWCHSKRHSKRVRVIDYVIDKLVASCRNHWDVIDVIDVIALFLLKKEENPKRERELTEHNHYLPDFIFIYDIYDIYVKYIKFIRFSDKAIYDVAMT